MANEALRLIGGGSVSEKADGDEVNLREVWRALLRRKWILLAMVLVVTGLAFAYVSRATPMYTAETLLHVTNRDAQVVEIDGVVDELIADAATMRDPAPQLARLHPPSSSRTWCRTPSSTPLCARKSRRRSPS